MCSGNDDINVTIEVNVITMKFIKILDWINSFNNNSYKFATVTHVSIVLFLFVLVTKIIHYHCTLLC